MSNKQMPTNSLHKLISENLRAQEYYLSLPDYMQGALEQHSDVIVTMEDLEQRAQQIGSNS